MPSFARRHMLALLPAAALLCAGDVLAADSLAEAKAAGLIGERPDGYVGVVPAEAPAAIVALAEAVNRERRTRYAEIARRNGSGVAAVEAVAGAKLLQSAPPGSWIMDASGRWIRK